MAQAQAPSQIPGLLDLVQLRWQFIRSVDTTQSIQKENIELKQEIAQLKLKLKSAAKEKAGVKSEILDKFKMQVDSYMLKDRTELIRLKQFIQSEQDVNMNMRLLLQRVVKQYDALLVEKEKRVEEIKAEFASSAKDIASLKKEVMQQREKHEEEKKKINQLNESQKQEIERLNVIVAKNLAELKSLTDQNEELNTKYSSFGKLLSVSLLIQ